MELTLGLGIKVNGILGTITKAQAGKYSAVLTDGTVITDAAAERFAVAEGTLHDQLHSALSMLAQARAQAADALRKHDDELALWREQHADEIARVSETKDLAAAIDQAVRTLVLRIQQETGDKKPHSHAQVSERGSVTVHVSDADLVKWAISANRPDALKPNTSQVNVLVKAGGIVPADIASLTKAQVVSIDTDLSDMLTPQETAKEETPTA